MKRVPGSSGRLYVRSTGGGKRRSFYYRRQVNDNGTVKDIRVSLGPNLERATLEAKRLDAETDARLRGEETRKDAILGEYIAVYIGHIRDERKFLGWRTPAGNLAIFAEFIGGDRPLRSITRADIERFQDWRKQRARPVTVNGSMRDVKRMLNVAVEGGYLDANPAMKIRPLPASRKPVLLPTEVEMGQLLGSLKSRGSWLYPLVLLLAGVGCRLGEALRMDWRDVDPERGRLVLRRRKTSDALAMALGGPLRDALRELAFSQGYPREGLVFGDAHGVERPRFGVRQSLKVEARRVGLGWITPRVFRRLAGTTVAEMTGDIRAAQMLLGHSTVTTTEGYLGRREEARARGTDAMAAYLDRATGTKTGTQAESVSPVEQGIGVKR